MSHEKNSNLRKEIGKICGFDWDIWEDNNRGFRVQELKIILAHLCGFERDVYLDRARYLNQEELTAILKKLQS